jgi:hypothetical protein
MKEPNNLEELDSLLKNWALLNVKLMEVDEDTASLLLRREKTSRARLRVMLRIYNRLSKLRSIREKQELAVGAKG